MRQVEKVDIHSVKADDDLSEASAGRVYGFELVIDLHGCESALFNRRDIDRYFTQLCNLIEMEKCEVHFWDGRWRFGRRQANSTPY